MHYLCTKKCDQIGDFYSFLDTNFFTKVAQMYGHFGAISKTSLFK